MCQERPADAPAWMIEYLQALKAGSSPVSFGSPRPRTAAGTFLRVLSINDVYKLDNYPHVTSAIRAAKAEAAALDCVVISTLNGDFLSPCILSALDGGKSMVEALNVVGIDYVGLGNHEFDFGFHALAARLADFRGKAINSNVSSEPLDKLPRYERIKVGSREVVLAGLLTHDMTIYGTPKTTPMVVKPIEAASAVWD